MGETVREIIARLLLEEVSDPRVALVTVTGVDMSPDLQHANVYFTAHDAERAAEALAGLDSAKGRLRTMLAARISLRRAPELHFRIDPAIEEANRISEAIRRERELGRAGSDDPEVELEGTGETAADGSADEA